MNSERARLIRGGADHAPLVWPGSDNHWLALQRRVVALLDRREKSVHVNVENRPRHGIKLPSRPCK